VPPVGYYFPDRAVGSTSPPQSFTITNTGASALNFDPDETPIQISGADSAMFALTNNCPDRILAGGQCSVSVTFTPESVGIKSASLDIYFFAEQDY